MIRMNRGRCRRPMGTLVRMAALLPLLCLFTAAPAKGEGALSSLLERISDAAGGLFDKTEATAAPAQTAAPSEAAESGKAAAPGEADASGEVSASGEAAASGEVSASGEAAASSEAAAPSGRVALPMPLNEDPGYVADPARYLSDTHYLDETLEVKITTDKHLDCDVWIADVTIADPSQLRSAFCDTYVSSRTTHAARIARRVNAVFAVNGDFYSYDFWAGVVIRNGVEYRRRPDGIADVLLIDESGDLSCVLTATPEEMNEALERMGGAIADGGTVLHALTFGPALVVDGEVVEDDRPRYNVGRDNLTQRVAIAQAGPLHYLIVACSGPESRGSRGMTIGEFAEYMKGLGALVAYNLDGGSSASMIFNGEKINSLDTGKVRPISDILYFSTGILPEG